MSGSGVFASSSSLLIRTHNRARYQPEIPLIAPTEIVEPPLNPLFVTYDNDDEVSGVRYMQLTAVNTKAIQELHSTEITDVRELRTKIDREQAEIDELKRTIQQLTNGEK